MAILNALSIETTFQLTGVPPNFKFEDDTDYAAEGIALADVDGIFKVVDPTGATLHNNTDFGTPDIDADASLIFSAVNLPLDANGDVLKGKYVITYSIQVGGAVQAGTYVKSFTYDNTYEQPTADIDITIDYFCATITSTDNTPYPAGSVIDTRTHTLHPPPGSGLSDTVGSTQVITAGSLVTKTWTGEIDTDITVTQTDALKLEDTITGTSEREVKTDLNLCQIQCCLESVTKNWLAKRTSNPIEADRILDEQLNPAIINAFMFRNSVECGKNDLAETFFNAVLEFTECDLTCACEDSEVPTVVLPICVGSPGSTSVVAVCGTNTALTVTANTVGDTTTYTVCFDQVLFTKLGGLNSDYDVTSADASVAVVTTTDANDIKTFDLSVGGQTIPSIAGQRVEITLAPSLLPAVVVDKDTLYGALLQKPTVASDNTGGGFGTWAPRNNCWTVSAYDDSSGGAGLDIKPSVQVTKLVDQAGADYDCDSWIDLVAKVVNIDYAAGTMQIRFAKGDGEQVSNQALIDQFTKIEISLTLTA